MVARICWSAHRLRFTAKINLLTMATVQFHYLMIIITNHFILLVNRIESGTGIQLIELHRAHLRKELDFVISKFLFFHCRYGIFLLYE